MTLFLCLIDFDFLIIFKNFYLYFSYFISKANNDKG